VAPEQRSLPATSAKSAELPPVKDGALIGLDVVCPPFVMVKVTGADVVPSVVDGNVLPGLGVTSSDGLLSVAPCRVVDAVPPGTAAIARVALSANGVVGV
jgi:hypothetical protein